MRIPDDHVSVSANAPRIRKLNLADKEHYLASDNVLTLAEELGWWSPKSGEAFEFCYAYGGRTSMGSRRREWAALNAIAPSLKLDANAENYPVSVKAERKLTVKDVLEIFRNTYQGTPYDMTRSLTMVNRQGQVIRNPIANPFMNNDYLQAFNIASERTIACKRATYLQITQSRSWLPDAIGGVVWLGYDNPATTPHMPFYAGITSDAGVVHGRRPREIPPGLRVVGIPPAGPAGLPALAGHGEGHREGLDAHRGEGLCRPGEDRSRGGRALQAGSERRRASS